MSIEPKVLAVGKLLTAKAVIYSPPAGSDGIIKCLNLFNDSGDPQSVIIYLKNAAAVEVKIANIYYEPGYSSQLSDGETIYVEDGGSLSMETTDDDMVSYYISGAERVVLTP